MQLILGSGSPRRQDILKQVNVDFTVRTPNVDESQIKTTKPIEKVSALCKLKAASIIFEADDEIIVTADTVVSYKNMIFEKPKTKQEAYTMMRALSGQTHEVHTGVLVNSKHKQELFVETTKVIFYPLTDEEINDYIETDEPYDKAGAYGIQGLAAPFIKKIDGDYYNVVGLPIGRLMQVLKNFNDH
ncbi:septum formation protein Maf [Halolactibacillus miurensis]|uniref:dTTP/UTP pyrophosphatase n=1 Tax=Halolactibacillus miurensis TaxID=306541 RepID=A0A1I6R186_9BACI|nr:MULTISPECIES: Maf family protein [Halolactibacillus]GEM03668.1 septum formation protein Maf [Halolactibacillus miurensis]SFS58466.1 septum formation protein [Halolactibacillus miurensis]